MCRMGLSSQHYVDRLHIIYRQKQRSSTAPGAARSSGEASQRTAGTSSVGGTGGTGGGEECPVPTSPVGGARQGNQAPSGGAGAGSPGKQRSSAAGATTQKSIDDTDTGGTPGEKRSCGGGGGGGGGVWGDGGESIGHGAVDAMGEDDYSHTLKIKAAQALFRMSLEPGGEVMSLCP